MITPYVGGVPFQVCVFFARHLDEELTTNDVCDKFGATPNDLHRTVSTAVENGWLSREKRRFGWRDQCIYKAGPALRALIYAERAQ